MKRSCNQKWKENHAKAMQQRSQDPKWLYKITESAIGGFWYGNVKYNDRKLYCELWNRDLWNRIDAFQNYKSILSDKTKKDNNGKNLSRHHVYYNPKACCEWDEDIRGYYVMIDIGVRGNSKMHKYYIDGDPNKFVLLTRSEHAIVAKDKIKWIEIFEKLIETKYNGKCYYTKEEYAKLGL